MEQKFEKSFIEKFGDFYSKMGRRALFALGCIGLGVLLEFLLAGVGVIGLGGAIAAYSVFNLISFCEKEKTRYLTSVQVILPNGNKISCALFEQRVYAFAPFIMAFFSLGYYIPYKKQYILVRNMEIKNLAPGTRVSPLFLTLGVLDVELLPKSKYLAIIANPQIISGEIYAHMLPRREVFLREAKPFLETGLLEEIYHTDRLSICRLFDNESYILFHYESHSGIQYGLIFNKAYIDRIKEDDSFLLESYIQMKNPSVIPLTNEVLERFLRRRNSSECSGELKAEETKTNADVKNEVVNNYINELNKDKKVFTREMIFSRLKSGKCTWRMVWGIILLYFSLGGFALTIGGIGSGMIILTVLGLPAWVLLTYFAVKNIKISTKNRNALKTGQYKIQKVTCTEMIKEQRTDEDGDPCGYEYVHRFSNGDDLKCNNMIAVEGDTAYLVYLNDNKKISAFFNAVEYVPADDLVIEE